MDRCKLLQEEAIFTARLFRSLGGRLIHAVVCLDFGKSNHPTENMVHFLLFVKLWLIGTDLFPFLPLFQFLSRNTCALREAWGLAQYWLIRLPYDEAGLQAFLLLDYYLPFSTGQATLTFPRKDNDNNSAGERGCFLFSGPDLSITLSSV